MFTNKHLIVAMLVAPVLAVMAWFAIDYFVAERPHAAQPGATYTLLAKSNCRYDSGRCDLENSDFRLSLQPMSSTPDALTIGLDSAFPLQSATIGIVDAGIERPPVRMQQSDDSAMRWSAPVAWPRDDTSLVRVAVAANGAFWYAEVAAIFLDLPD